MRIFFERKDWWIVINKRFFSNYSYCNVRIYFFTIVGVLFYEDSVSQFIRKFEHLGKKKSSFFSLDKIAGNFEIDREGGRRKQNGRVYREALGGLYQLSRGVSTTALSSRWISLRTVHRPVLRIWAAPIHPYQPLYHNSCRPSRCIVNVTRDRFFLTPVYVCVCGAATNRGYIRMKVNCRWNCFRNEIDSFPSSSFLLPVKIQSSSILERKILPASF